jgi:stage II sporulation protein D
MTRVGPWLTATRSLALACACVSGAAALACAPTRSTVPMLPAGAAPAIPAFVRVGNIEGRPDAIQQVPIEEYVLASVLSEVAPAKADPAALERLFEVQAIVARTYAAANPGRHTVEGFDLCATTHCQLVDFRRPATSSWKAQAERAVAHTVGVILSYDGRPAQTVFHADCGGHTSSAAEVWGGTPRPYLRGLPDNLPAGARHQTWRFEATAKSLLGALNKDSRTAVGANLEGVDILRRDAGGRVLSLRLRGPRTVTVPADDFRAILARQFGARSIMSAHFDLQRRQDSYLFEGRGFGHGVGLCQTGAQARTANGMSALAVLALYYPGTRPAAARPATSTPPRRRPAAGL